MSDSSERSSAPSPADAVPPALAARWEQAGGQLFGPLAMDPERYQQVVLVLAGLLEQLRAATPSTAALLEVAEGAPELARDALARAAGGAPPVGTDADLLAQAALAQRLRELRPIEQARRRLDALGQAATGAWVVLEESGDRDGDPYFPYRRLEADPSSGHAVLVRSDPDEDYARCEHRVLAGRIDLRTGRLTLADDEEEPLPDVAARERRVAELRLPTGPGLG